MSADAKVWQYDESGWLWRGRHDGYCCLSIPHDQGNDTLSELIASIERCMGHHLRWTVHMYPEGKVGLKGRLA